MSNIKAVNFSERGLVDFGQTVSRTPITKTLDNITGRETLTSGTPANITATIAIGTFDFKQYEDLKLESAPDGIICVSTSTTLNEQDLITVDSKTFEVSKVKTVKAGTVSILKKGALLLKS